MEQGGKVLQQGQQNGSAPSVLDGGGAGQGKVVQSFGAVSLERSAELAAIAVAAASKAEVEASYVMAMKRPRNEEDARVKIVTTCGNPFFARKAIYKKPVGGGEFVEGPSIRLAEEMLRAWGNVKTLQTAIYEDDARRIVKVTVIDLETNISYSKEISITKTVERKSAKGRDVVGERINSYDQRIFIVKATDDELLNKEAALVSKTIRNNGLRMIPQHIIDEACLRVRKTIAAGVKEDPSRARNELLNEFARFGITPSHIEKHIGHAVAQLTDSEIVELQSALNAIADEQTTWAEYSGEKKEGRAEPDTGSLDSLSAAQSQQASPVGDPLKETEKQVETTGDVDTATPGQAHALQHYHVNKVIDMNTEFKRLNKSDYSELTNAEAAEILTRAANGQKKRAR